MNLIHIRTATGQTLIGQSRKTANRKTGLGKSLETWPVATALGSNIQHATASVLLVELESAYRKSWGQDDFPSNESASDAAVRRAKITFSSPKCQRTFRPDHALQKVLYTTLVFDMMAPSCISHEPAANA